MIFIASPYSLFDYGRTIYSAGLRAHQQVAMANGSKLNLFSRDGSNKYFIPFTPVSLFQTG